MRTRWLIAGFLIVVGLVWIAQGTGLIQGRSVMTDDVRWAIAGLVLAGIGVIVAVTGLRSRPSV